MVCQMLIGVRGEVINVTRTVIMSFLAATLVLAQEKNTHHPANHFVRPLVAATHISQSELPRTFAATDVRVLGDLDYGQTSGPVGYSANPPYRAFAFNAFGGET